MGSYNVSCGITNLTINEGDEVVIFPLTKNENKNNTSPLMEAYDMFLPKTLPIFAVYNDTGSFTNFRKDENYKILEKEFGKKFFTSISGMYVHKKVWDTFLSFKENMLTGEFDSNPTKSMTLGAIYPLITLFKISKENKTKIDKPLPKFELSLMNRADLNVFNKLYMKPFINEEKEIMQAMENLYIFSENMHLVSKSFSLTLLGPQCGCPEAQRILLKTTEEILNKQESL